MAYHCHAPACNPDGLHPTVAANDPPLLLIARGDCEGKLGGSAVKKTMAYEPRSQFLHISPSTRLNSRSLSVTTV